MRMSCHGAARVSTGRLALLAATLGLALAGALSAQGVAPAEQATMFSRIFGFDRALSAPVTVLLVHPADDADRARELATAFGEAGISAVSVAPAELASRAGEGAVVYFLPGTTSPAVRDVVASRRLLSIAGDAASAEQGLVSVGLGAAGGKTEIVVHLPRLHEEGHDLSAQLLKIARVVRDSAPAGDLEPPVLVAFDAPAYPPLAKRLRVQGDVVLELTVEADGSVSGVDLVKGVSQNVGINEAAAAAARGARFTPAKQGGVPVQSVYTLSIPFRL